MSPSAVQRVKRIAARARTLALVYFLVLLVSTHLPPEQVRAVTTTSDKWLHFGGYAVLTLLVLAGWELTVGKLQPKHYFAVWLAGVMYGAIDEVSQTPVGRTCDMNDWAADVLGVVAGLLVFRLSRTALHRAIAWTAPAASGE